MAEVQRTHRKPSMAHGTEADCLTKESSWDRRTVSKNTAFEKGGWDVYDKEVI